MLLTYRRERERHDDEGDDLGCGHGTPLRMIHPFVTPSGL